jgi:hypothetical protein
MKTNTSNNSHIDQILQVSNTSLSSTRTSLQISQDTIWQKTAVQFDYIERLPPFFKQEYDGKSIQTDQILHA